MAEDAEVPKSKRLFINYVDLYQGSNFAKFLSTCVVGASLEDVVEEEEEETKSVSSLSQQKGGCYEIIATLKNKDAKKPDYVKEVIQYETREQLYEHLYECDVIVYDITEDPDQIDEATWAVSELHSDLEKIDSSITFILVSTVLTWARSKPLDPDDPDIPFTEEDYRRRKPHPNYKDHISAEKTVIKLGKTNKGKLTTYVVSSGLTYGCGEGIFHFLFKAAWHNAEQLPVFGNGENVIPTIHIKDLAAVIQNIADSKPKTRYLVAVDDSQNTLDEIVKAVSQNLGTGQKKLVSKEEALLMKDIQQSDFDQLMVDLRMDSVFVKEGMHIRWVAETGVVENIEPVVREFRNSRGLLPMKLFVDGPPASGKTMLSERLCQYYNLHHIKLQTVIEEAVTLLEQRSLTEIDGEGSDDDETEDKQLLKRIQSLREESRDGIEDVGLDEILEDNHITRFISEKLQSTPCQNQGFVLDGYPRTYDQAKDLFSIDDGEESTAEESRQFSTDPAITPTHIFVLTAADEFLKDRVLNLPEVKLMQSYKSDSSYARLLSEYREASQEDDNKNIASLFADGEVSVDNIDIMTDKTANMDETFQRVVKNLGKNVTMKVNEHEKEAQLLSEMASELKRRAEEETAAQNLAQQTEEQHERDKQAKVHAYEKTVQEEMELLTEASLPLRNYLVSYVLPTLIKGLTEVCKERPSPEEAIDVLAEYLFKNNPQVGYDFPGALPWREAESDFSHEDLVNLLRQNLGTNMERAPLIKRPTTSTTSNTSF